MIVHPKGQNSAISDEQIMQGRTIRLQHSESNPNLCGWITKHRRAHVVKHSVLFLVSTICTYK